MHVRWLELAGFRTYTSLSFAPDPGLNVLIGPNGQGKSALLEALHILLSGRSFRTPRLAECLAWGAREGVIAGEVARGETSRTVRLGLAAREGGVGVTGSVCPWARAVTFSAVDLGLLTGGPPVRRGYLDGAAAKLVPAHAETTRRYRVVLHQRGRLLGRLAGRADAERLLGPWDEQVAALGSEIVHRRLDTVAALGPPARILWRELAPECAELALAYAPALPPGRDPAETRERLLAAMAAARARELARGLTLVGPHRDDLEVRLGRADARIYASRGEQRLLALTLRLAEAEPVARRLGSPPVFLLDDLLSELDAGARERLLGWLAGRGQVVFSTTDAVPLPARAGAMWEVRRGAVAVPTAMAAGGAA